MIITLTMHRAKNSASVETDGIAGWSCEIADAPLTGVSAKQISYATDIRAASVKEFVDVMAFNRVKLADGTSLKNATFATPEIEALVAKINATIATKLAPALASVTSAKTWIEANGGAKSMHTVKTILER